MGGFTMWNRRAFIRAIAVGGLGVSALPTLAVKQNKLTRILVLHTNDIHCRFEPFPANDPKNGGKGGLNRIAAYIEKMRENEPDLLLLDSGDFSQGTPYFNFFKSEVVLKLMTEMGYNAGTIGNHEFDNGLEGMAEGFPFASYPIISSNYDFSETILAGLVKKNLILERKGVKIGIYGLGIELNGLVDPLKSGKTKYLDPVETALHQEYLLKKEEKCDLVICLSHLGLEYAHDKISDKVLAGKTHFTDLILGGHTHSFLEKPLEVKNAGQQPIIVNQAGWAALQLGQIEFFVERERTPFFSFLNNKNV
jgi:5'-nucleotidase